MDKAKFSGLDTTQSDEEMAQVAENVEDEVCLKYRWGSQENSSSLA